MKISIVTGAFLSVPPAPCGAVERLWDDLAKRFVRRGHQVTVICRAHNALESHKVGNISNPAYVTVRGSKRDPRIIVNILADLAYSMRVLSVLPSSDILETNTFWLPILAPRFRPRAGHVAVNVQRVPKKQIRQYRRVSRLHAVSNSIYDDIKTQCPQALPLVRVIPNPIDGTIFVPLPKNRDPNQKILLYTGRLHPEKGVHLMVEAFASISPKYPELRLRLIGQTSVEDGGGGESYLAELRQKAGRAPISFDAPIYDRNLLAQALRDADFYCYPSIADRGESFGVAPLEAMATGHAPIVSNLSCFRDFLEDNKTAFVFDHHAANPVTALALAMEKAFVDPARTAAMGEIAAREAQNFDYEKVTDQYLADYESLLK